MLNELAVAHITQEHIESPFCLLSFGWICWWCTSVGSKVTTGFAILCTCAKRTAGWQGDSVKERIHPLIISLTCI